MRPIPLTLIGIAGLLVMSAADAVTMYKWKDKDGVSQYTQSPPPDGIEATVIDPPPAVDGTRSEQQLKQRQELLNGYQEAREKQMQEAQQQEEEMMVRRSNCQLGRDKLQRANGITRVYTADEQGNRTRLSEQQRQQQISEAQKLIADNCG